MRQEPQRCRQEPDHKTMLRSLKYHCNRKLLKGFNQGSDWLDLHSGKIPLAAAWRMD